MREAAQALAFGTRPLRKNFTQIHPYHRALREGEECNEANQEPDQILLMRLGPENVRDSKKTNRCAHRADHQQTFAPQLVNHSHSDGGEQQVRETHQHGLNIA